MTSFITQQQLVKFKNLVGTKFQLYNSLFTSLPFNKIETTGILLALFLENCEEGFRQRLSPKKIVDNFCEQHTSFMSEQDRVDFLFQLIKFAERQVVLFDALEDAAFSDFNDMEGLGTLKELHVLVETMEQQNLFVNLLHHFSVQLVLTAHPTQFYSGDVLGIINDLSVAIKNNATNDIESYLMQLGKTPFFNQHKPTPYEEAISLIWYLEHVFFDAVSLILDNMIRVYPDLKDAKQLQFLQLGFWPGGDRDGNPFVTSTITLQVAAALRRSILRCYLNELAQIKRRLTMKGLAAEIQQIEITLRTAIQESDSDRFFRIDDILSPLQRIKYILVKEHDGFFEQYVDVFIAKIKVFGTHFATLDIRQDSGIHDQIICELVHLGVLPTHYGTLSFEDKSRCLLALTQPSRKLQLSDPVYQDTLDTIATIKTIQHNNGEQGCNRYIISQCSHQIQVIELVGMFLLSGWDLNNLSVDFVPLFETIDDLLQAPQVMESLFQHHWYRTHLQHRNNIQTIMLGFSDGTKDGGYLAANWGIFKAKQALTTMAAQHGVSVVFFDGRGGPPARGGGKTHQFYSSMGTDKRNQHQRLTLKDLRAIPYVGSLSQIKQNITGYYGVGTALREMEQLGLWLSVQRLYQSSLFFRTLIDNCEMAMKKCFFPLTAHLQDHPDFGDIWCNIYAEYELSMAYIQKLSGSQIMMQRYPIESLSIQMRERIILPVLTIQQYALTLLRDLDSTSPLQVIYEKLVTRCSFGIINAGRNSA